MALIYLTNGLTEDPFLFVEKPGVREGFLFDCGLRLRSNLRRVRKLGGLFVTHAHIDHMIGLDHIIRSLLGESLRLRVFGPRGMIRRLEGRLASYDWDKSSDQSLVLDVTEAHPDGFRRAEFHCRRSFVLEPLPDEPSRSVLHRAGDFFVRWAEMDHGGSVCLAFACEEEGRWKIRPEALEELGMPPGPWVGDFLEQLASDPEAEGEVETPAGPWSMQELARKVTWFREGRKIAYVTDTRLTPETLERTRELAWKSDILISEATFLEEDREAAESFHHMTAGDAARIAREAQVRRLLLNHPSRRYHGMYEELLREARESFPATAFVQYRRRGTRIG